MGLNSLSFHSVCTVDTVGTLYTVQLRIFRALATFLPSASDHRFFFSNNGTITTVFQQLRQKFTAIV